MRLFVTLIVTALTLPTIAAELNAFTIENKSFPTTLYLNGTVEAVNQSTISAQISGEVVEINFDIDDFVNKGDVVILLKSKSQQASLAGAKAALSEANARFQQAQQEYKRIKDIYNKQLIARSALDKASAELKAASARKKSAQAAIDQSAEQVDNARVTAPYSGIVTQRHVELGEYVNTGQPLMTGLSIEKLRVNVNVPQNQIAAVKRYKEAIIETSDGSKPASAMTFFPYADPATHDFKVRVGLDESTTDLFPGSLIKVGFTTGKQQHLLVPAQAIAWRGEVSGIYVIDGQKGLHFYQVRLGKAVTSEAQEYYVVLAGLTEGDVVATDPVAATIALKAQRSQSHD